MKTMKEQKKLKRAVIKEELVELTNDPITAIILNQFIYWTERVSDFDKFISEETERAKSENKDVGIQHQNGWIYKKATELGEECMLKMSEVTVRAHIKKLIDLQLLKERKSPLFKWDKTLQYRLDIQELIRRLNGLGYALEGYRIQTNLDSKIKNLASEQKNLASEQKNLGAIPETTTEITTETTNKLSDEKKSEAITSDLSDVSLSLEERDLDDFNDLDVDLFSENENNVESETFLSIKGEKSPADAGQDKKENRNKKPLLKSPVHLDSKRFFEIFKKEFPEIPERGDKTSVIYAGRWAKQLKGDARKFLEFIRLFKDMNTRRLEENPKYAIVVLSIRSLWEKREKIWEGIVRESARAQKQKQVDDDWQEI